jgi:hypothetical protein
MDCSLCEIKSAEGEEVGGVPGRGVSSDALGRDMPCTA